MGTPGFQVTLKESGTPTLSTGESFSPDGSTVANRYQIDSTAKRVFDRNNRPSSYQTSTGGSISSTDVKSVDVLFGRVTFKSTHGSSITADVNYLPTSVVAGANSFELNHTVEIFDDTSFDTTGFRSRQPGFKDADLTISRFQSNPVTDSFWAEWLNKAGSTQVVIEIQPGSTGPFFRGFFTVTEDSRSGDIGSLESEDVTLQLNASTDTGMNWSDL